MTPRAGDQDQGARELAEEERDPRRRDRPEDELIMHLERDQRVAAGVGPHHLLAPRPHAHQRDGDTDVLGDELHVLARAIREVGEGAALAQVLGPAAQLGELGGGVVQHGLVVGEAVEHRAVAAAVARAHVDLLQAGEHV